MECQPSASRMHKLEMCWLKRKRHCIDLPSVGKQARKSPDKSYVQSHGPQEEEKQPASRNPKKTNEDLAGRLPFRVYCISQVQRMQLRNRAHTTNYAKEGLSTCLLAGSFETPLSSRDDMSSPASSMSIWRERWSS